MHVCLTLNPSPQLYGAATMNNTLCLGVFAALVYFRELDWQFSAGKQCNYFSIFKINHGVYI